MKYLINKMNVTYDHNKWGGLMVKMFASFQRSKDQTSWVVLCVVNNGMLTEYSLIEFLS